MLLYTVLIAIILVLVFIIYWEKKHHMSTRRKIAMASWSASTHPNMLGELTLNIEPALAYLDKLQKDTNTKVTLTTLMGKALGLAMSCVPDANCKMLFGKLIPLPTVDVCFLVAIGNDQSRSPSSPSNDGVSEGKSAQKADLGKATVQEIDKKSLAEISTELVNKSQKVRSGKDADFNKTNDAIRMLPTWVISLVAGFTGWLSSSLEVNIPALGVKKREFGNAIVTSVAMFDIDTAFAPPTPFCRVPIYLCIGAIRKGVAVDENEKIVIQRQVTVTATIDHRFMDGAESGKLASTFRKIMENPQKYLDSKGATNWPALQENMNSKKQK